MFNILKEYKYNVSKEYKSNFSPKNVSNEEDLQITDSSITDAQIENSDIIQSTSSQTENENIGASSNNTHVSFKQKVKNFFSKFNTKKDSKNKIVGHLSFHNVFYHTHDFYELQMACKMHDVRIIEMSQPVISLYQQYTRFTITFKTMDFPKQAISIIMNVTEPEALQSLYNEYIDSLSNPKKILLLKNIDLCYTSIKMKVKIINNMRY